MISEVLILFVPDYYLVYLLSIATLEHTFVLFCSRRMLQSQQSFATKGATVTYAKPLQQNQNTNESNLQKYKFE